jgi:FkbM family methyltransferase
MAIAYVRWSMQKVPKIPVPGGGELAGLRHFSEYLSVLGDLPSAKELEFVRSRLKQGGIALDIGANVGTYAHVLENAGATQVHAFEPLPSTFQILSKNVAACTKVILRNAAMSDAVGTSLFTDLPGNHATNHLVISQGTQPCIVVQTDTIDNYCNQSGIDRIAFLKLDVEGAEPAVLRGARQMLSERRIDAAMIEIVPSNLVARGFSENTLRSTIERHGYSIAQLSLRNFAMAQDRNRERPTWLRAPLGK